MKGFSKKAVSIILSLVMIVTTLQAFAVSVYARTTTNWNVVASTDFTQASWSQTAQNGTDHYLSTGDSSYVPTTSLGGTRLRWGGVEYNRSTRDTSATYGALINDGNIFLGGSETGSVPIAGSSAFKIDIQFTFTDNFSIGSRSDSGKGKTFIKLSTAGNMDFRKEDPWTNNFFSHEGYGRSHYMENGSDVNVDADYEGGSSRITTDNLTVNKEYHYILTYENNRLYARVVDASGSNVLLYSRIDRAFDTSTIKGLYIGATNGSYYQKLAIKSVVMYTGTTTSYNDYTFDTSKNKYVFTYFTGNDDEGETLKMAVSDDGFNWEALNGNDPIWDKTKLTGSEQSYPNNNGIAATGNVRDPYAFRAEDGSFYVLATDLQSHDWDSDHYAIENSKLMVWHLNSLADLANTNPWYIDIQSICVNSGLIGSSDRIQRSWAPEAIWDPEVGHYMLFWSIGYVNGKTHMYYAYTDDFKTLLTNPSRLVQNSDDDIDGNITYDGNQYYLWYKNESKKRIGYSVSDHASGPYSSFNTFEDGDYGSSFEGPEVYRLASTGSYVLMADHYQSKRSFFAAYTSNGAPTGFVNNQITSSMNLNYLNPRHGSVINITTEEYNELVDTYGKVSFQGSSVKANENANDFLVARYFTTDDATYDATGHGYSLTNPGNGVTMLGNMSGRIAAQFSGTAADQMADAAANTTNDSYSKSKPYAYVNTSSMLEGINEKEGVTFSWYGYAVNCSSGRWFDWSTVSNPGTVSWDNELGTGQSQTNNAYIYAASNMKFGANNNGENCISDSYKGTGMKGAWHLYTYTVSKNYLTFAVDGKILQWMYAKNGESVTRTGAPIGLSSMNSDFFDRMKNGYLYLGISSFAADYMLNAYISDFRVYNRALSAPDIQASLSDLEAYYPDSMLDDASAGSGRVYYDPMETKTVDGVGYTAYSATVDDEIHQKVLNINGGVNSEYSYNGSLTTKSKGYTISMWYNPGANVSQETIFQIGKKNSDAVNNRRYLELQEDGHLWFNYELTGNASYMDATGVFGSSPLVANKWSHIVLQLKPNGNTAIIYVYIDGKLVSTINMFSTGFSHTNVAGRSPIDFLGLDHNVYYGSSCGYWSGANQDCFLDDFAIYNGLYSAKEIYKLDSRTIADTLLPLGIQHYETAMSALGGSNVDYVYTNMGAAYNCYDRVMRYLDATDPAKGKQEKDPAYIVELYSELEEAIDNMKPFRKPSGYQGLAPSQTALTQSISAKFTNNLLTVPSIKSFEECFKSGTSGDRGTAGDHQNFKISNQKYVWMYTGIDGDIPTAPINSGVYTNDGTTNYQCYLDVTAGDVMLGQRELGGDVYLTDSKRTIASDDKWIYRSDSRDNIDWFYEGGSSPYQACYCNDTNNNSYYVKTQNGNWYYGSCYISYTGTMSDSTYITTTTPTFRSYTYWKSWGSGNNTKYNINGTITIVNFNPLRKAMIDSNRRAKLANITSYNPASCKELLGVYDEIINKNYILGSYDDASTLSSQIQQLKAKLEGVNLSTIVAKADDTALVSTAAAQTSFYDKAMENVNDFGSVTAISSSNYAHLKDEHGQDQIFTTSSWKAYQHAYNRITEYFAELNPYGSDDPYAISQTQLDSLKNNVLKAQQSLQVAADFSDVDNAINDEDVAQDKSLGNYSEGAQINTYSSYMAFANAYDAADAWYKKDEAYRADTLKYNIGYVTSYTKDGTTYTTGPYIAYDTAGNVVTTNSQTIDHYAFVGEFYDNETDTEPSQFETGDYALVDGVMTKLNGHRYYVDSSTIGTTQLSPNQNSINTTAAALLTADENLVPVDNADAYAAFDSALNVVSSFDEDKYIDPIAVRNRLSAIKSNVYKTLTDTELSAYNKACNKLLPEGTEVKLTAEHETDPQTVNLLNKNTEINVTDKATYVKRFNAKLIINGGTPQTLAPQYYGDEFSFDVSSIAPSGAFVSWEIQTFKDNFVTVVTDTTLRTAQSTLSLIADNNVIVRATILDVTSSTQNIVKVYNPFGKLVDIQYTEASSVDTSSLSAGKIPFYEFKNWKVYEETDEDTGVKTFSVVPYYAATPTYALTTTDGTISKATAPYNTLITVDATGVDNFYAWAAKADTKYYVVSYNSNYSFYSIANTAFTPITKVGDKYYIEGNELTADMIDFTTSYTGEDKLSYVTHKLDNYDPFIAVVKKSAEAEDSKTRHYAYCQVTEQKQGIERKPMALGIVMNNGSREITSKISNCLDNGQFYVTVLSVRDTMSFKATLGYDYTYRFTGTNTSQDASTKINVVDTSATV